MLELSIRPARAREVASMLIAFIGLSTRNLFLRLLKGCGESQIRLTQDSGVLDRE